MTNNDSCSYLRSLILSVMFLFVGSMSVFADLKSDLNNAAEGSTVTMTSDWSGDNLVITKPMTLDLNGHQYKNILYIRNTYGEVIVKNGTITQNIDGKPETNDYFSGKVTLEDVTLNGSLYVDGHEVTIVSGSYNYIQNENIKGVKGTVKITGSDTYVNEINTNSSSSNGGTVIVMGGNYKQDPTKFVNVELGAGYAVFDIANNGNYTKNVSKVAAVNVTTNTNYTDLQDAVKNAGAGNVVKMCSDYNGTLHITKPIILSMQGHTIESLYFEEINGTVEINGGTLSSWSWGYSKNSQNYPNNVVLNNLNALNYFDTMGHNYKVNSGTYKSLENTDDGTLIIRGGKTFVERINSGVRSYETEGTVLMGGVYPENPIDSKSGNFKMVKLADGYRVVTLDKAPEGAPSSDYIYKVVGSVKEADYIYPHHVYRVFHM